MSSLNPLLNWKIECLDDYLWTLRGTIDDDTVEFYNIAFLPNLTVLYGTSGVQNYRVDISMPTMELRKVFPDLNAIIEHSVFETEGVTDKEAFIRTLTVLYAKEIDQPNSMSFQTFLRLSEFIVECDCPPDVVEKKLLQMGFGDILPKLVWKKPKPLLLKLSEVMHLFCKLVAETYGR